MTVPATYRLQARSSSVGDVGRAFAADDDQEYRGRVLLLGKGALFAHRLARPLAAESDDDEQSGCRTRHYRDP
jgi:hypothetical protein